MLYNDIILHRSVLYNYDIRNIIINRCQINPHFNELIDESFHKHIMKGTNNMSDQELLKLLKDSPQSGLEELTCQYGGLVYTICRSRLSSVCGEKDIEDFTSDVLAEFYRDSRQIDLSKGSIKSFLAVYTKRKSIDNFRHRMKQQSNTCSTEESGIDEIADSQNVEREVLAKETRQEVLAAVKSLGEPDSEILIRKYYLGQMTKEIAKSLKMKENTVDKRISRSLQKLRSMIGGIV